ncbi:3-hydroxyacyl-CoA dehydrogenase NAD-binding domain-containing protein [Streptomyces sp. NBC_00572]|uniref:3-hydroxyacyl-CoA dehydrogenase NAD-binding domain-containing protein n=1 Tax=Streptomyces sp. NBC_00572 TaxID=2903664 RepID=UPI002259F526|nr:3-hydroxyacyl-CoA dehydrogenase NAD-binding domain-containing protein [Streptomyces sp. NBC_00572]MCX4984943.1 3-hydroxyacyl-CoA dehydrogenase NAD-binding domain-containing protein [Streptomyces sp. NBC_00572]
MRQPAVETVTAAHVRFLDLPEEAGRFALITLDNGLPPMGPAMRPATFGPEGLAALDAALDTVAAAARAGEIAGVGITGKAFVFSTGADLALAAAVTSREEASATLRQGTRVFRRLGELPVPSFAFVNGVAIGGGVELALHCTYRTLSRSAPALALPECSLGLVPAWGGAWLLPRLVGPDTSVTLMLDHPLAGRRMLDAPTAHGLGLADTLVEPGGFLQLSLQWAADVLSGTTVVERAGTFDDAAWDTALDRGREVVAARTHGVLPAPRHLLELLELARRGERDEVFAAAEEAATELFMSREFRASLYALRLTQTHAAGHPGQPDPRRARPVRRIGILGSGATARRLALLCLTKLRIPVVLVDDGQETVDAALAHVRKELDRLVAEGRISADGADSCAGLISVSTEPATALAAADAVIEATPGDLEAVRESLRRAENAVPVTCPLVSTTPVWSRSELVAGLKSPERLVRLHFPNVGETGALAELAGSREVDEAARATAGQLAGKLGMQCLPVADSPGLVVNRLRARFLGTLLAAAGESAGAGDAAAAIDGACEELALPVPPSRVLRELGEETVGRLLETMPGDPPGGGITPGAPLDGALAALAHEIRLLVDEGVVADARDVDFALLTCGDWPFHLGGVTPRLDDSGISEKTLGRRLGEWPTAPGTDA